MNLPRAKSAKILKRTLGRYVREDMAADVSVFDPAHIIDNATYEKPHQYATGVEYVIVNGGVVLEKTKHTGARTGQILRIQR